MPPFTKEVGIQRRRFVEKFLRSHANASYSEVGEAVINRFPDNPAPSGSFISGIKRTLDLITDEAPVRSSEKSNARKALEEDTDSVIPAGTPTPIIKFAERGKSICNDFDLEYITIFKDGTTKMKRNPPEDTFQV